ncbi:MAG TPA: methylmalonyl-CoA mutase family protein, partial [Chitinophagales bacterium]|nr:methylmalonyl-CoA mutase family protein [Chitinophagales bacterium]
NIMRRMMQASGAEVIHLGHNRSVQEIVNCAIQEDAQAIAITSYQGGHVEFFKYMRDLLNERGAQHIKIFGGGGGTILPTEIEELHQYGIDRIYSPDDGRAMGLQGMINDLLQQADFPVGNRLNGELQHLAPQEPQALARLISAAENYPQTLQPLMQLLPTKAAAKTIPVLGITGTGGSGKSSLVDELVRRFLLDFPDKYIAIVSVDPSKRKSGGALLGDRIRMNAINHPHVYMRSLATRQANLALSRHIPDVVQLLKTAGFDFIILETSGIGQSDTEIVDFSDVSLYVMTPEYGAASQLEKIDMIDFADVIAINKFDKRGAADALRDVKKQYKRARNLWTTPDEELPVFGTIASQFNDPGTNRLYKNLMGVIAAKTGAPLQSTLQIPLGESEKIYVIPPARTRYLSEIAENNRRYDAWVNRQAEIAQQLGALKKVMELFSTGREKPKTIQFVPIEKTESGVDIFQEDALLKAKTKTTEEQSIEKSDYSGKYHYKVNAHPNLKTFKRELRENMTPAEAKLWSLIQKRQVNGRKFRKQHAVGFYILDFYCPEEHLAIELDGNVHFNVGALTYDEERTTFLNTYGIYVLRFENKWVFEQPDAVIEAIKQAFGWQARVYPPQPPLKKGGSSDANPTTEEAEKSSITPPFFEGGQGGENLLQINPTADKEKGNDTPPFFEGGQGGELLAKYTQLQKYLAPECHEILENWQNTKARYAAPEFVYKVRGKEIRVKTHTESLSHNQIPKIALPRYTDWGDILRWNLQENVPGEFPYTAGVFPFKRENEDPTRMFAGEGNPERTNKRFHYVSLGMPAKRLSTAFDSVTLYGEDPDYRPDIYGKIGNSGVSVCCLDDAKKLYSGFNLCLPNVSVSMTINGPAATVTAFFLNAAIDQQCELYIKQNGLEEEVRAKIAQIYAAKNQTPPTYHAAQLPEGNNGLGLMLLGVTGSDVLPPDVYNQIKAYTLHQVRGTVQADILKEDQAQNTCIFSTEFSLRLMGDMQQYFIDQSVKNFYSVSISGYHIAEAGANPISQLAFTLANGFTYVEYYLSRGMHIDDFAPNLSFFFSNGIDPEYAVIGRVARRIWAKAMKLKYHADERSQKLKYHIQTSGRSLHAQEISFNDIRTTLQALYAIYDNCNSLHTNAYDEAITTPTEESVRRAMAIQLIINHELGLAKNQNPLQGSFIIEELTDLVEEAVLAEFDRITERGGVLGAMETMYQRGKIQEESLYYETLKHEGKLPIIGVNTFLSSEGSPTIIPQEVIRSTQTEKEAQIQTLQTLHHFHEQTAARQLKHLQQVAIQNGNMFEALMEAVKYCSLGQITNALYEVGGEYRRNM